MPRRRRPKPKRTTGKRVTRRCTIANSTPELTARARPPGLLATVQAEWVALSATFSFWARKNGKSPKGGLPRNEPFNVVLKGQRPETDQTSTNGLAVS